MTNTEKRLEFEEEVAKELGYVSALFMSQECKGTEIVMPTEELKEVADRIRLYAFFSIQQAVEEERARVVEELFEMEKNKWKDVEHCTCLGYAIIQVVGGEDSKEGKEMSKRLSSLKEKSL